MGAGSPGTDTGMLQMTARVVDMAEKITPTGMTLPTEALTIAMIRARETGTVTATTTIPETAIAMVATATDHAMEETPHTMAREIIRTAPAVKANVRAIVEVSTVMIWAAIPIATKETTAASATIQRTKEARSVTIPVQTGTIRTEDACILPTATQTLTHEATTSTTEQTIPLTTETAFHAERIPEETVTPTTIEAEQILLPSVHAETEVNHS